MSSTPCKDAGGLAKRSETSSCRSAMHANVSDTSFKTLFRQVEHSLHSSQGCVAEPRAVWTGLVGRVWRLSRDEKGCRRVQAAVETCAQDRDLQVTLAAELKGHVWEAIRCPHANHVLQCCITALPLEASQFILYEVLQRGPGAATQVACHRFGCRVLERVLEGYSHAQLRPLVEEVIAEAVTLGRHTYGNYVLQHALKYGPPDQRQRLYEILDCHLPTLAPDSYGSAVLVRALSTGEVSTRRALARHAAAMPGLVPAMARSRHGPAAMRIVLQLLPADEAMAVQQALGEAGCTGTLSKVARSSAARSGRSRRLLRMK